MEQEFLRALDEHFCAHYSDYVRLSAIEGYIMPEVITVDGDGNIARRDASCMRLVHQSDCAALLARFKEGLADTEFTFSFVLRGLADKWHDLRDKMTFAKVLPKVLAHSGERAESAGAMLAIQPRFWQMMVKGKVYPAKNTVLALALVCRLSVADARLLLAACGYALEEDNVRDVVVGYLLEQKVFNPAMRDRCLAEYKIDCLPIARENA